MSDRLGNLDGKAKVLGPRCGPALVSCRPMRAVERGVDLNGVEDRAVALQVGPLTRKRGSVLLRTAPPASAVPRGQSFLPRRLKPGAAAVKTSWAASRRHSAKPRRSR